jgi:hypothetical protein
MGRAQAAMKPLQCSYSWTRGQGPSTLQCCTGPRPTTLQCWYSLYIDTRLCILKHFCSFQCTSVLRFGLVSVLLIGSEHIYQCLAVGDTGVHWMSFVARVIK